MAAGVCTRSPRGPEAQSHMSLPSGSKAKMWGQEAKFVFHKDSHKREITLAGTGGGQDVGMVLGLSQ